MILKSSFPQSRGSIPGNPGYPVERRKETGCALPEVSAQSEKGFRMIDVFAPKDPQARRKGFYVLLDQRIGGEPQSDGKGRHPFFLDRNRLAVQVGIVGWYRVLNCVNGSYTRLRLEGLNPAYCYRNSQSGICCFGDELMYAGMITSDGTAGQVPPDVTLYTDFESRIYVLEVTEP